MPLFPLPPAGLPGLHYRQQPFTFPFPHRRRQAAVLFFRQLFLFIPENFPLHAAGLRPALRNAGP